MGIFEEFLACYFSFLLISPVMYVNTHMGLHFRKAGSLHFLGKACPSSLYLLSSSPLTSLSTSSLSPAALATWRWRAGAKKKSVIVK